MRVRVVVGFVEPTGFTRVKNDVLEINDAYATELIELGKVVAVSDQPEASKVKSTARKASKKNERTTILSRRRRR